jgi:hypothetical protein
MATHSYIGYTTIGIRILDVINKRKGYIMEFAEMCFLTAVAKYRVFVE